jgi:dipeptidyl aminopeptidase/acylaminoacyl peptidase
MRARALVISFVLAALPARVVAEGRAWTLDDTVEVEAIDDVQLAPDGKLALIAVVRGDARRNTFARAYQLVDLATGKTTALAERLQNPRWSPGGAAIAWLARGKTGAAIVVTNARGGGERALTTSPRSVAAFAWSPDGKRIAAIEEAAAPAAADQARFRLFFTEHGERGAAVLTATLHAMTIGIVVSALVGI